MELKSFYIKCTKCGNFNKINSQHLLFCHKCKKRLDNNYLVWREKHQNNSFEKFLKSDWVCDKIEIKKEIPIEPDWEKIFSIGALIIFIIGLTILNVVEIEYFTHHIPSGYEMGGIIIWMLEKKVGIFFVIATILAMVVSYLVSKRCWVSLVIGIFISMLLTICQYLICFNPHLIGL
jgi:hypothetical protein